MATRPATDARQMRTFDRGRYLRRSHRRLLGWRGLVEVLEALQVDHARAQGWSWRDIASRLGVSKQAVHYKHGLRFRRR